MEVEGTPLLQVVSVTTAQGARRSSLAVASRWWAVARLWWRSSDRKRAWTYVAACAAFSLANVGLLLWISYAQNALQSSLSEKQAGAHGWGRRSVPALASGCTCVPACGPALLGCLLAPAPAADSARCLRPAPSAARFPRPSGQQPRRSTLLLPCSSPADGFYAAVRDFVLIIILATPLFALTDYVDSCLTVAWRRWLTQHMLRCGVKRRCLKARRGAPAPPARAWAAHEGPHATPACCWPSATAWCGPPTAAAGTSGETASGAQVRPPRSTHSRTHPTPPTHTRTHAHVHTTTTTTLTSTTRSAYFAHHAYFKLKLDPQAIDNPDQRICEDVRAFCATSVGLAVSIVRKVFNCVAFAGGREAGRAARQRAARLGWLGSALCGRAQAAAPMPARGAGWLQARTSRTGASSCWPVWR